MRNGTLIPRDRLLALRGQMAARSAELVRDYPGDPRSHAFLAMTYADARDFDGAEREARIALADEKLLRAVAPPKVESLMRFVLATVLERDGRGQDALPEFDQAIALDPGNPASFLGRADAYLKLGQPERALADYDETLRLKASPAALGGRGISRFMLGRYAAAADDFAASAVANPSFPYTPLWLYLARQRSGIDGSAELRRDSARIDRSDWPGPIFDYYLGSLSGDELRRLAARDEESKNDRICEANFYVAERLLIERKVEAAEPMLREAAADCPVDFFEKSWAAAEWATLRPGFKSAE